MSDDQIRLECLRLAIAAQASDPVHSAQKMMEFVSPAAASHSSLEQRQPKSD